MIHFVMGKPGNGKGACFAWEIADALVTGDSNILAAFATEVQPWVNGHGKAQMGLKHYLRRTNKGKDFDCENRVRLLDDSQDSEFYLWRLNENGKLFQLDCNRDAKGQVVDFDIDGACKSKPCEYFIDEVGQLFDSRGFLGTPKGVLFYFAQHRHIGDTVWLASQSHKDCDVSIVRKCQDFYLCRNRSFLKIGLFRQPDDFVIHVYENPPSGASNQLPQSTFTRKYDDGLLETFDTTAGVRHRGGRARGDLKRKKAGLSYKYMLFALAMVPVICFFTLWEINRWTQKGVRHLTKAVLEPVNKPSTNSFLFSHGIIPLPGRVGTASDNVPSVEPLTVPAAPPVVTNTLVSVVFATGYSFEPGPNRTTRVRVFLSDGRVADSQFGEVQKIERYSVTVFGLKMDLLLKPPAASPQFFNGWNTATFPSSSEPSSSGGSIEIIPFGSPVPKPKPISVLPETRYMPPPFTPGIHPQNN